MSQIVALTVHVREGKGTRLARKLRDTGMIPGIVYGHKETPVQVSVSAKDFNHAVRVLKARTIEIDLREMLGETEIPAPLTPQGHILM